MTCDEHSRARAEQSRRIGPRQDCVVAELAAIASATLSDFAEWGADGMTLKLSATVDGRPVLPIKQSERVIRWFDNGAFLMGRERWSTLQHKLAALCLLGKHLGLFPERQQRSNDSEPMQVEV